MYTLDSLSNNEQTKLAHQLKEIICCNNPSFRLSEGLLIRIFITNNIQYPGLNAVLNFLSSKYAPSTFEKILKSTKKMKKTVIPDTCLCRLSVDELKELFAQDDIFFLIPNLVIQELTSKLNPNQSNYESFKFVCRTAAEDTESQKTAIIDIPKITNYTDNSLLAFCKENPNYTFYTCDYNLALRFRCARVPFKLFHNEISTISYTPNQNGPNIVISPTLLSRVKLKDLLNEVTKLHANKIIISSSFLAHADKLESSECREYTRFFINDKLEDYTIFVDQQFEDPFEMRSFCIENNAVFLTSTFADSFMYKENYIPYKYLNQ